MIMLVILSPVEHVTRLSENIMNDNAPNFESCGTRDNNCRNELCVLFISRDFFLLFKLE